MHDWIQLEKMVSYTSVWSFRFFYWLFEWFTHSFNWNLAVYEQGFVPINSCLAEQILVFIWHLVVGSGTHWKINLEIASSYARLGMFPTALIFLILECRHEPVMKQKLPTKKNKTKQKQKQKQKKTNKLKILINRQIQCTWHFQGNKAYRKQELIPSGTLKGVYGGFAPFQIYPIKYIKFPPPLPICPHHFLMEYHVSLPIK